MISGFGHYKYEKENPKIHKFHVPRTFQTQGDIPIAITGGRDGSEKSTEVKVIRNSPVVQEIRELCKCLAASEPKKQTFVTLGQSEISSYKNVFPTQQSGPLKSKNQRLKSLFLN
jgi:hypothetical protein